MRTILSERLGYKHPIFSAPMAGGGTTPELVAAVSEAGGLGFLAAAYLLPAQILEAARAVQARTSKPFGINLFAPLPRPGLPADASFVLARLAPYHAELGLPEPKLPTEATFEFSEQLAACLECGATVLSFTFGLLPEDAMGALRARGLLAIGTATTVAEAIQLEAAGVDAIVAQGSEAGAHRGTFAASFKASMVGTMALVPQAVDAVRVPVIASGGIMDGRGIAAALALGASAVQMGTAFLTSHEAGIPEAYKATILAAREDETRVTRAFSGRPARGIVNRFIREVEPGTGPDLILPYPLQNDLTRTLRGAAARQNRPEFLSLWAGQGVRMARREAASDLIARLVDETAATIRGLSRNTLER
jgi:nitronate monooxygenase